LIIIFGKVFGLKLVDSKRELGADKIDAEEYKKYRGQKVGARPVNRQEIMVLEDYVEKRPTRVEIRDIAHHKGFC
jgi:hypothetical protein